MKAKSLFLTIFASLTALVACQEEQAYLGIPNITLSEEEIDFEVAGGEKTIVLTASRDWKYDSDVDWLMVSPESGTASTGDYTIVVTALENTGLNRTANLKFTIGMKSRYLVVNQVGPRGSVEDLVVYSNNFDKTEAVKASSGWNTYLDSFDGWLNATGTGVSSVIYGFDRMTARTNSGNGSAGSYSDYVELGASGTNYLWFGTGEPYFAIKNITLPAGVKDYTLSFGTERYLYGADNNTFNWDEFKVYISADGKKWIRPAFDFASGSLPNGRWDLASATISLPEGTTALYVYFAAALESAYAIDDVKLVQSETAGTPVDFSEAEEFEVEDKLANGDSGQGGGDAPSGGKSQISGIIAAADNTAVEVEALVVATYARGVLLKDETGYLLVYKGEEAAAVAGDMVNVKGTKTTYAGLAQIGTPEISVLSSGNAVTHPSPKVLAGSAFDSQLSSKTVEYVEYTGVLEISGYYYNVTVSGATTAVGSLSYPAESLGLAAMNGKTIKVTGYFVGVSSSKFVNTMVVSVQVVEGGDDGSTDNPGDNPDTPGTPDTPDTPEVTPLEVEVNSSLTWTLGTNAYDNTYTTPQTAVVNGVEVTNVLKLGKSSAGGSATVAIPSGVTKVGFVALAWKGNSTVLTCKSGDVTKEYALRTDDTVTGNPPYTINATGEDYYIFDLPEGATEMTFETTGTSNCRAVIFGVNPVTE